MLVKRLLNKTATENFQSNRAAVRKYHSAQKMTHSIKTAYHAINIFSSIQIFEVKDKKASFRTHDNQGWLRNEK